MKNAVYLDVDVQDVVEAIDSSYYSTSLGEPIYERTVLHFGRRNELKINIIRCGLKIALGDEIDKPDEKEVNSL